MLDAHHRNVIASPEGPWSCANGGPKPAVPAHGVEAVVTLDHFADFAVCGGLHRLALAAPKHPLGYDFYADLRPALQSAHALGHLDDVRWSDTGDMRRERIFPVIAKAYATAVRRHKMAFRRAEPRMLHVHPLDILVEPLGMWSGGRGGSDIAIFPRFDSQKAGPKRIGVVLAAARLVGFHGGFVDLQADGDLVLGVEGMGSDERLLAYFRAEALAFAEMRRAAR